MKFTKFLVFIFIFCLALVTPSLAAAGEIEWEVNSHEVRSLDDVEIKNVLLSAGVENQELVFFVDWSGYRVYINVVPTADTYTLETRFVPESRDLYLRVSSTSGSSGKLHVFAPKNLISNPENIEVYIDNEPLQRTITELENYYIIYSNVTFSERIILIRLSPPSVPPIGDTQLLNLTLIALVIVGALGAIYWFKFRR